MLTSSWATWHAGPWVQPELQDRKMYAPRTLVYNRGMRISWNYLLALTLSATLLACGDDAPVDDIDASPPDGNATTTTWSLRPATIRTIASYDPIEVNTDRTTRVLVTTELDDCEDLAMPAFTWNEIDQEVLVEMRVWQPLDAPCSGQPAVIERPVSLRLPTQGTWTVRPGPDGAGGDPLTIEVGEAPISICNPDLTVTCAVDCECPSDEACLGGSGLTGSFTQCARPCELSRDCKGNGRCVTTDDGLSHYCDESALECDDLTPCPAGYSCTDRVCQLDLVLDETTRVPCSGDGDCTAPLRCVEGTLPDRPARCELACPTESVAWCSSMYTCGAAADDVAELAPADSVCIFTRE
jgi:hypothetical protein